MARVRGWTGSRLRRTVQLTVFRRERRLSDASHVQPVRSGIRVHHPLSQPKSRPSAGLEADQHHHRIQTDLSAAGSSNRGSTASTSRGRLLFQTVLHGRLSQSTLCPKKRPPFYFSNNSVKN